jgi:hypothetical protein
VAAVGIEFALQRLSRRVRLALVLSLIAIVIAESALPVVFVRVPTSAGDGGIDLALRARPPGIAVELPLASAARGVMWPYVESPRQLLALRDHDPRINGYSGFQPRGVDALAAALDQFPNPDALTVLRRLRVRYVVMRTALVGVLTPAGLLPQIARDGAGRYAPATAELLVRQIPRGVAARVDRLPGGILVELAK